MKKRLIATYHRWNDSVEHFCRTEIGRACYLSLLGLAVPAAWILGFIEFQTSGEVAFTTAWLIWGLTWLVGVSLSSKLSWTNELPPQPSRPQARPTQTQLTPEEMRQRRAEAKKLAHQESHQEHRAQGTRVIVDAVAFKYGVSRKHFERAPWYRN